MNSRMTLAALLAAAVLSACAGNQSSPASTNGYLPSSVVERPIAATTTTFPASQTIGSGEIFGTDDAWAPNDGDTVNGGRGQMIDGNIPCMAKMFSNYHVHAFIGIIINGNQLALPDGTGMKRPGPDITFQGIPNWTETATCYYYLHTHDASGVVHIESPQNVSLSSSLYTLGNYFNVWGMKLSPTQVGPHKGTVVAFVANVPLGQTSVPQSAYSQYTGDPNTIPLYSHTCVWLEIGPTIVQPSSFPVLNYYMEY